MLTVREVKGRYRGSVLGVAWAIANPVVMLAIYTLVFSVLFPGRGSVYGSMTAFASFLFCGLILHGLMTEPMNAAPRLIARNVNYVKKIMFPLEILPWVSMGVTLFNAGISFLILLMFLVIFGSGVSWTALLLPLIVLPLVLMTQGFLWGLAAAGVYIRDVGELVGFAARALLFISPVFYPVKNVPEAYRSLYYMNPLVFPIEQMRAILLSGRLPDWSGLLGYSIVAIMVMWSGFCFFQKSRRGFADVI